MSQRNEFYNWLMQQARRSDSVGIFAKHIQADANAPRRAYRPAAFRQYLRKTGAPQSAIDGITPAFHAFADYNGKVQP